MPWGKCPASYCLCEGRASPTAHSASLVQDCRRLPLDIPMELPLFGPFVSFLVQVTLNVNGLPPWAGWCLPLCVTAPFATPSFLAEPNSLCSWWQCSYQPEWAQEPICGLKTHLWEMLCRAPSCVQSSQMVLGAAVLASAPSRGAELLAMQQCP